MTSLSLSLGVGVTSTKRTGGGGQQPSPGYVFLRGKLPGGEYVNLTGLNADTSRSNLQGKAA